VACPRISLGTLLSRTHQKTLFRYFKIYLLLVETVKITSFSVTVEIKQIYCGKKSKEH